MFDAIIIGTGPAGGMAAVRLAEAGANILILEKAELPRHKACGGGLTPPVQELIDWDFTRFVQARIVATRWQLDHGAPLDVVEGAPMMMIGRREFDAHFIERAVRIGRGTVTVRDGYSISHVSEEADGVTVVGSDGERVRAAFVVGADGAFGKTAACIGLGRRTKPGIAIDADVRVTAAAWATEHDRMSFNFACLPAGYGWIFPKDDHLSCGVGSWSGNVALPAQLDAYLARALPPGSIVRQVRRGHPIPLYEGAATIDTRRVLLTGDAASLVDPIMGEGIRFALHSGAIAAQVILERLARGPDAPVASHTERVKQAFAAEFDSLVRFIQPIFLRSPELFYRRFYLEGESYFALARALEQRFSSPASSGAARG